MQQAYSRDVTDTTFFAVHNFAENATHDLATSGFGKIFDDEDDLWCGKGANQGANVADELLFVARHIGS